MQGLVIQMSIWCHSNFSLKFKQINCLFPASAVSICLFLHEKEKQNPTVRGEKLISEINIWLELVFPVPCSERWGKL